MRSSENKKRWARIQPIASSICKARVTKSLAGRTVVKLVGRPFYTSKAGMDWETSGRFLFKGTALKKITSFGSESTYAFDVSPEGNLVVARGATSATQF